MLGHMGPRNHALDGVQIPQGKGQILGECIGRLWHHRAKMAEPIKLLFVRGGPTESCIRRACTLAPPGKYV